MDEKNWGFYYDPNDEFINYDELYKILYDKYKSTHEEIRYWIIKHNSVSSNSVGTIIPFLSDLPRCIYMDEKEQDVYISLINPPSSFFIPQYHFYLKSQATNFHPKFCRFVYLKDLTSLRNWYDFKRNESHSMIYALLIKANAAGILRLYDDTIDEFTLYNPNYSHPKEGKKWFWGATADGEKYLSSPDSFFLITDILNIERIFFNKPREECLKEMRNLFNNGMIQ